MFQEKGFLVQFSALKEKNTKKFMKLRQKKREQRNSSISGR